MSVLGKVFYRVGQTRSGSRILRGGVRALRKVGLLNSFWLPLDGLELPDDAIRVLMRLWSRIHWATSDGMMPADELLAIVRTALDAPPKGDIVELGSWTGLTTCYLAALQQLNGQGMVFAVDTFEGTREGGRRYRGVERLGGSTLAAFDETIARAGVGSIVRKLVGTTTQVAQQYEGDPIRVLLIDADHSYEGVSADFDCWSQHVCSDGIIVLHDCKMSGVARFVQQDLTDKRDQWTTVMIHENVGVIRRAAVPHVSRLDCSSNIERTPIFPSSFSSLGINPDAGAVELGNLQ